MQQEQQEAENELKTLDQNDSVVTGNLDHSIHELKKRVSKGENIDDMISELGYDD